ncbi:MAG: acyltransferase [Candidatus Altimarinota bacterium]
MEVYKYKYIDALRGWAILGVLFFHQFGTISNNFFILTFTDLGARGVQLFYIMSALTLFLSMEKRTSHEKYPFLFFFIRRFFRIAPLFYLIFLFFYFFKEAHIPVEGILSILTFTNGWNPYWINPVVPGQWSVAIEMIFYLMIPFLFTYINTLRRALFGTFISFLFGAGLILYFQLKPLIPDEDLWINFLRFFLPAQLPVFFLGFTLYFLIKERERFSYQKVFKYCLIAVSILGVVFLSSIYFLGFSHLNRCLPYYLTTFGSSLFLMFFAYYLSSHYLRFFVNRITMHIGKISYSMYLTHYIILGAKDKYFGVLTLADFSALSSGVVLSVLHFFLLVLGTVILSTITYYLIEKPGQLLGKKIIQTLS